MRTATPNPSGLPFPLLLALFFLLNACAEPAEPEPSFRTWQAFGGDPGNNQYSELGQINRDNVTQLQIAWTYSSGDIGPEARTQIQCNPIVIDSVLYATSPKLKVLALHAGTGVLLWSFDPYAYIEDLEGPGINRGVVYWSKGDDRRILFSAGARLFALDADTGEPISSFGENGTVELHEGLGRDVRGLSVSSRTPGVIYQDLLILGTSLSEGPATAPGHVRAYNVRTGEIAWIFHTIPQPGEVGYETWPEDAWERIGGANAWTGMSVDVERGLVFIPTGSAAFDFWGGNRKGENLFANALLVLKAATGERVWHYQTVHHDIWDRDLPAAPNLVTVEHEGRMIDAVAQITKSGYVFLFDRETGEPLFPIEERPFPPSDLFQEEAWPTQPIPVKPPPFARQALTEDNLTDRTPEAHAAVLARFQQVRSAGQFVPASVEGTVIFPGFDGGGEWGGAAFDPVTGRLIVNSNEMPWILTMLDLRLEAGGSTGSALFTVNCAVCHGIDRKGTAGGIFPSLEHVADSLTEEQVAQQILNGKGFMPSFRFLSESQRQALVAFLFGREGERPTSKEPEAAGNPFAGSPYGHTGYNRFFDPDGYPAVKPPWGTLNAINLNTGEIDWQVPLGEFPELTAQGLPPTGTENYGGPVVTAGGLILIGATKDEMFRAFDKDSGALLWETKLPAGGYATPATYEVNGKQYVVIAAGGGKMGTKSGDSYVAFALPE